MLNNIVKGTLSGVFAKATTSICYFLIVPLMVSHLGSEQYGIWMTITAVVGLTGFLDLGIGNTLMNYVAKNSSDKFQLKKNITLAYTILLIVDVSVIIIFLLVYEFINWKEILHIQQSSPEIIVTIVASFCLFFFSLFSNLIYYVQRGMQRSDIANYWQMASSLLYFFAMWFVVKYHPSLRNVALVSFGVPVLTALINSVWFFNYSNLIDLSFRSVRLNDVRPFLANSTAFSLLQFTAVVAFQTDSIIIAHTLTFQQVSEYAVAAKLFSVPAIALSIYTMPLWPAYTQAFAKGQISWIKKTFFRSIKVSLVLTGLFVILVFCFRNLIMQLWLAGQVGISIPLVIAFSLWCILNIAFDSHVAILLNAIHRLKIQVISSIFMIVSNVILSIYLAQKIGVQGVVYGTFISTLVCSTIPMFYYTFRIFRRQQQRIS